MTVYCIVKGCENHTAAGEFVGDLCKPCHRMLTSGKVRASTARYVKTIELEALRSKVDMIQEKLEVDECLAVEIADFIEMFTKRWKE